MSVGGVEGQMNRIVRERDLALGALRKIYEALMRDPPHGPQKHIGPDDVIYQLDGQLMYHAINAARDALKIQSSAGERSND